MAIINSVISGGNNNDGHYINLEPDSNGKLIMGNGPVNLAGIKDLGDGVLRYCRQGSNYTGELFINAEELTQITGAQALVGCGLNSHISSFSLPNLETISGSNVFSYGGANAFTTTSTTNGYLTTVSLPKLTTVTNGGANAMFAGCSALKSIYLPKITSMTYGSRPESRDFFAFSGSGLQIADLRNLTTVGDYGIFDNMFNGTLYLTTVNLNSLEHIGTEAARAMFSCSATPTSTLTDLYFPMLTTFGSNPFYSNAFNSRLGLTIHFRKDAQATVEALANYATLWGAGTGSSVVFDLAGTLTGADSNAYTRSEINSVYASETAGAAKTATGWKYNDIVYYTSGGTEPAVGDTIYSDAACTTAVTTISAIA
jgi:hypothetical protein